MNLIPYPHKPHPVFEAIERAGHLQPSTREQYARAATTYLDTGNTLADPAALAAYAAAVPHATRAFLKAAVRLWADDMILQAKAGAAPENIAQVQAAVYRLEAITAAIDARQPRGTRSHIWLTAGEVRELLQSCDDTPAGRRDRIVLSVLVGSGLRRAEAASLTFEGIAYIPTARGKRPVLNIMGKGAKSRVVPISMALSNALTAWQGVVGSGAICRGLTRGSNLRPTISESGIYRIVNSRGALIGLPDLAPHDLRRTYAQLGFMAGVPISQLSRLLGHSSIQTTQRYLDLDLDLESSASDFVPLE